MFTFQAWFFGSGTCLLYRISDTVNYSQEPSLSKSFMLAMFFWRHINSKIGVVNLILVWFGTFFLSWLCKRRIQGSDQKSEYVKKLKINIRTCLRWWPNWSRIKTPYTKPVTLPDLVLICHVIVSRAISKIIRCANLKTVSLIQKRGKILKRSTIFFWFNANRLHIKTTPNYWKKKRRS